MKSHSDPPKGDRRVAKFLPMLFEHLADERCGSCRAVDVPGFAYFGAGCSFADGEPVELDGTPGSDELEDVERELRQTLLKIEAGVVDLRERLVRFAAKALDAADEQAAFSSEFRVDSALRAARLLNNPVEAYAIIAMLQEQVRRNLLKSAVPVLSP